MSDVSEHIDLEALAELKEVMEDEFDILIETYLTDSESRVDQLQQALDAGDADAYSKAAHSFKGSCTNIGAPALAKLCFQAEMDGRNGDISRAPEQVEAIKVEFEQVRHCLREVLAQ